MTFKRCVGLALALGAICFLFRTAVWAVAYDSAAQLLIDPGLVLIFNLFLCMCGALTVIFYLLRWPSGCTAPAPYSAATPVQRLLRLAAALGTLASGVLLLTELRGELTFIPVLMGLLLVAQGVVLVLLTTLRDTASKRYASLLLVPAFTSCYWLVSFYHRFGSDPEQQAYLWPILAGILTAVVWIGYAGFAYEAKSGKWFGALALLALIALPAAMAAPLPLSYRLSLLGQLIWFWAALLALKPRPAPEPALEREETPHV